MPNMPAVCGEQMATASLDKHRYRSPAPRAAGSFYRPELDVLRFAAFMLVFLHHTVPRQGLIAHLGPRLSAIGTSFSKACGFGLCLFFTLSAYLITELLIREKEARGRLDVKAFYIRRILRIWPLYFLGLAIGIAFAFLKRAPGILERYAAYAVLVGNWYCAVHIGSIGKSPMEILWSISVEEQFYLFWPWVASSKAKKLLGIAAISLLAASPVALIVVAKIGASTDAAWFNSFVQFGMFGAGAMLSLKLSRGTPRWSNPMRAAAALGAMALWILAVSAFHLKDPGPTSAFNLVVGYTAVELGCVLLLLSIMGVAPQRLPRVLIYLGRVSFGLYVFHELGLEIASHLSHWLGTGYSGFIQTILGLALTIALASLSYNFYEKPFLKLKKRRELVKSRPV
jgi:peptidoglycan/LPS O-acetylase OafA/YrhL